MAKILIVDDEESIRFTFDSFLSDVGHKVTTASDYHEALEILSRNELDLIFMDIVLGGKTGIDLLREVKDRNMRCPVVMITGYPNVETASAALRLGAFDYIFKPVKQEILLHIASMALQYKTLQDENEKYRANLEAIFKSVKDAIITVDKDLFILEVNEAAGKICGMTRSSIGEPLGAMQTNCNYKCLDALKKTILEKQPFEVQRTECEHNGTYRQVVTINTSPLINSSGAFSGAVMVVRDDTRLNELERDLGKLRKFHHIIGQNRQMQKIYSLIEDLADVETTVLITGESGTGKELVAEAIHYKGKRSSKPLVKVNCSALSENLLESELFGHVRGAFTGADKDRIGRFQRADGGTIFLDEIGDLSQQMQLRLLRVLQDKVFERVGDSTPIKADVRVITATNRDLPRKVKSGEFREDLYYRLKVVELALPPLRERKDDILLLVNYFIQKFNDKFSKNIAAISDDVKKIFLDYSWPGNIRELEHTMEHAFVIARQDTITVDQLPRNFTAHPAMNVPSPTGEPEEGPEVIVDALKRAGWNKSKAARLLGINVRTIYRKIEKYNIQQEQT
jgi:two-component system response regulator HydG